LLVLRIDKILGGTKMEKIVVLGGGTMGLDIVHVFARSGKKVVLRVRNMNKPYIANLPRPSISSFPRAKWMSHQGRYSWQRYRHRRHE
jgi:3-hydroxyacyl-CoA dehydrogenase